MEKMIEKPCLSVCQNCQTACKKDSQCGSRQESCGTCLSGQCGRYQGRDS
jgi:hypothetical protein